MKNHEKIAYDFATALIKNDFKLAYSLLSPELQQCLSMDTVRDEFQSMYMGYAAGKPSSLYFDENNTLNEWLAKQNNDIAWVYIGIEGEDFVEAIAVIVSDINNKLLIREIEWGRP